MNNDYLIHYGVLGMKWGVRKSRSSGSSSKTKRSKRTVDPSYKKAHSKTKLKYMSDSDLKAVNNRLQAERQYKSLTKKKSIGSKAVKAFISTAGTITAVTGAYKAYRKIGNDVLDKIGKMSV